MTPVGIGFAGVGFMGQVAHLRNYAQNPECRIVAIAEPRPELAQLVADAFGVPKVYRSHEELAQDEEVQAVVASQPHLRNGSIAIPLLAAGKHVFIEKPIAGSLAEAQAIQQAADAAGVFVMVGLMKRYDTSVLEARERLQQFTASGELGKLRRIRAHCFGGDLDTRRAATDSHAGRAACGSRFYAGLSGLDGRRAGAPVPVLPQHHGAQY